MQKIVMLTCAWVPRAFLWLFLQAPSHSAWAEAGAKTAMPTLAAGSCAAYDAEVAYFGVYVGGQKVGWMQTQKNLGPAPCLSYALHAQVQGMGRMTQIDVFETRLYQPGDNGLLMHIAFAQKSDTGTMQVEGKRLNANDTNMTLSMHIAGQAQVVQMSVPERLGDATAAEALARAARQQDAKKSIRAYHLDPALQKLLALDVRLLDTSETLMGGVAQKTCRIETSIADLQIREDSVLDADGRVIKSQVGGFFEARREDEAMAKTQTAVADILVGAVVKVPKAIVDPSRVTELEVTFSGMGADFVFPKALRQKVMRTKNTVRVTTHQQSNFLQEPPKQRAQLTQDARAALKAEPLVQSDAPLIKEAARKILVEAQAHTDAERVQALCHGVHRMVAPQYVPAFSNALETLMSKRGDCTEYSVLLVAMARAVGMPARVAVGLVYWPPGNGFGWHAWAEVFVHGEWVAVDATWDQPLADPTHIKVADGGPLQQARLIMLLGQLKVESLRTKTTSARFWDKP